MKVSDALREAATRLAQTSDTARLDAELLMAHALGTTRSDMLLNRVKDAVPEDFAKLIDRRAQCEPVAYITGHQEFRGHDLLVTPAVLIPRADSETTLQAALDAVPWASRALDCGTGSGALLLAFLAERPEASGIGIDSSQSAIEVARRNAARLELKSRADFVQADWNIAGWADKLGTFDLIIANPPYVESTAQLSADVQDFEPHGALFAGEDGLDDYHQLLPQLRNLLTTTGAAVLEIGAGQSDQIGKIAQDHGFTAALSRDLANRPRALILR